jgi:hypothetical protein
VFEPRGLRDYWIKVLALELFIVGCLVSFGLVGLPDWLDLALLPLALGQTLLVYRMLAREGRRTGIVFIFFLVLKFGPSVQIGNRELFLSQLIYLLPILIAGWPRPDPITPPAAG